MGFKKILVSFLLAAAFLLAATNSFASHIFGGELLYKHISGNTYRITLTVYGDCSASIFSSLDNSSPTIHIYNGSLEYKSIILKTDTLDLEVSPVCPSEINNTSCHINGKLPGVAKFVFSDTITLPGASPNWRFFFAGQIMNVSAGAGRSNNITNIAQGSSTQLDATLNNLNGPNSSPNYSTIPTPFYCNHVNQQYNQGAIDADGDSLAFSLVPGINANPLNPLLSPLVSYITPYTATEPLSTETGSFMFNELNGQMSFTPNISQNALIVNQVSEYRHGVLVGTSKREMAFIITDNCEGTPPSLNVKNIRGGALTSNNIIKICAGTPTLTFKIDLNNPDGDNTAIATGDTPPAATLSVNNNNTPSPSIDFAWVTDTLTTGIYTFYVYVQNDHCPIANRQTIAYTINVVPLPTISAKLIAPTQCVHDAYVQYNLTNGYTPRTVTIKEGSEIIKTLTDTTGTVMDSLPAGDYIVIGSSNPLCQISTAFSITDSGKLPLAPYDVSYCQGVAVTPLQIPVPGTGTDVTWYSTDNTILPLAPTPNTAVPGTYNWYAAEHYKVCTSDKALVTAVVHPLPDIQIKNRPQSICYGDTIYLEATGGIAYTWSPVDRIGASADGRLFARMVTGGVFTVKVVNEFDCADSSSVTYTNIQPCCNFFYPNAFTPNGDHNNDGFKVVTHGNMYDYRLMIYNRWGQVVYTSVDPGEYWDGKLYGTPCEVGTYYYIFKGRCLTGVTEEKKGDVVLIR